MEVELIEEHKDGSASFRFDMTPEETEMMVLFGIRRAVEEGIKQAMEWKHDNNSTTNLSNS